MICACASVPTNILGGSFITESIACSFKIASRSDLFFSPDTKPSGTIRPSCPCDLSELRFCAMNMNSADVWTAAFALTVRPARFRISSYPFLHLFLMNGGLHRARSTDSGSMPIVRIR
ncbi:hypothetical protein D3C75_1090980 [compost metagenome]